MAAISLFWYTNMAAVTSDENDLYIQHKLRGASGWKAGYLNHTRRSLTISKVNFPAACLETWKYFSKILSGSIEVRFSNALK
jgi:hypothetical protein